MPDGLEDVDLAVAEGVSVDAGGGFHGDDGEDLEQVVLHHVAYDAGSVVVAGAVADGEILGDGDLDVVDVVAVPEGLEEDVAKAEDHEVLHGLLAEVVVDAVDLLLAEEGVDDAVEVLRGVEIATEGFLDDDAAPAVALVGHAAGAHVAQGHLVEGGRYGEVVEAIGDALEAALELGQQLLQELEVLKVVEAAGDVVEVMGEVLPLVRADGEGAELADALPDELAEALVREGGAGEADEVHLSGAAAVAAELEEGGDELAARQVAGGAHDDDGDGLAGHHSAFLTAWPPNWLRMAARSLAPKESSWRERKRIWRARVMTGVGTARATDSSTVQRPSPESST